MNLRTAFPLVAAVATVLFIAGSGCFPVLTGAPCETDANCPSGQFCNAQKVCDRTGCQGDGCTSAGGGGAGGGVGGGTGGGADACDGGIVCSGACVSANDPAHCGSCTTSCTATQTCFGGACLNPSCVDSQCAAGQVCVDGACTDKSCLTVPCNAFSTCVGGVCVPRACSTGNCATGSACIDAGCVDVGCQGVTCADGGACQLGRCDGNTGCINGVLDPNESDVDCGGSCHACVDGKKCGVPADCASGVCDADGGVCAAGCTNGVTCGTNPGAPCKSGKVACTGTTPACVDGTNAAEGQQCGTNQVCVAGACTACTDGQACSSNSDPCKAGTVSCSPTVTCQNGTAKAAGASCGVGQVCTAAGACVACAADAPCSTNPGAPCKDGKVSCAGGVPACVDGANSSTVTSCGSDKVCSNGACVSCATGTICGSNAGAPCKVGVTTCTPVIGCGDGANVSGGATCGSSQVCNGNGQCVNCVANQACSTNPGSPCMGGVTSCSTGVSVCQDASPTAAGTTCGTNKVCNGAGVCVGCTAGAACAGNPSPCRDGVSSCSTGASVCIDGAAKSMGTSCGASQVCDGSGFCGACSAGSACSGNPNACKVGTVSCTTGSAVCTDGAARPAGTSCGVGLVCTSGAACVACSAGVACSSNPTSACYNGVTSCSTGAQTCIDGTQKAAGTSCGTNQVCSVSGSCVACTAGSSCATNPTPCKTGVTSCSTGAQTCDDFSDRAAGSSCGANLVCNGTGSCVACSAGAVCGGNPNSSCFNGTVSCATGASVCTDGTQKAAGTGCGLNQVCNPSGQCAVCTAGNACGTNPGSACYAGVTSCTTGVQTCIDGAPKSPGTGCGSNLVCNGSGSCVACTAGNACSGNPGVCRNGTTSCATGAQTCVDGSNKGAGTNCGAGMVCDGAGFCGSCTAGNACNGNPNNGCFAGVTSCTTGSTTCVDGAARSTGTPCGTNLVCNSSNQCVACTADLSCGTNPSPCKTGNTSCATGTSVCLDFGNKGPGVSCGTNQVCNGSGSCVACTAGNSCVGNPNPCTNGVTSCASGSQTCVDGSNKAAGASCGANQVCNGSGTCVACTAGLGCATNPNNNCYTGVTSCSTGAQTCIDNTPRAAGTSCGTNQVCNGSGSCVACTAGNVCSTNPNPCKKGVTSCSTGAQTCADGSNQPGGLSCGSNQVCDGNGNCGACTANQACATNPNSCFNGVTSCSTGTSVCVNATPKAVGTSCGTNQVCNNANQCVACTAGNSCTGNPGVCNNGVTSCNTGASACVDGSGKAPGTVCGVNMVCDDSKVCISCTAGVACNTNPGWPCKLGVTSCSTGALTCVDGAAAGQQTFYLDSDGDGQGNPNSSVVVCGTPPTAPAGYVANNLDCCDTDARAKVGGTFQGTQRIGCLGYDFDCSGGTDTLENPNPFQGCINGSMCGATPLGFNCQNVTGFQPGWASTAACNTSCSGSTYVSCVPGPAPTCGSNGQLVTACGVQTLCGSSCTVSNGCTCGAQPNSCIYSTMNATQRCK